MKNLFFRGLKLLAYSLLLTASLFAQNTGHGPVTKTTSGANVNKIDEDLIFGSGRTGSFLAGSTFSINGALNGTPTGGALSLANLTLTLASNQVSWAWVNKSGAVAADVGAAPLAGSSSIVTVGTLTSGATGAGFTISLSTSAVTGVLAVAHGGFGADVSAVNGVPLFAAGSPTFISTIGTGNFVRAISPTITGTAIISGSTFASNAVAALNSITAGTGQSLTLATLDSNANILISPHGTGWTQFSGAISKPTVGTAGNWSFTAQSLAVTGGTNDTMQFGYNWTNAGQIKDLSDVQFYDGWETFWPTGGHNTIERYSRIILPPPSNATFWEPFFYSFARDTQRILHFDIRGDQIIFEDGAASAAQIATLTTSLASFQGEIRTASTSGVSNIAPGASDDAMLTAANASQSWSWRLIGADGTFRLRNNSVTASYPLVMMPHSAGDAVQVGAGGGTASSWTTSGVVLRAVGGTYTNSSTAGSGTAATAVFNSFAEPTLAATNASVTTTDASTVYIAGVPAAGANMTITRAHALTVNEAVAATSSLIGGVSIGNGSAATNVTIGAGIINAGNAVVAPAITAMAGADLNITAGDVSHNVIIGGGSAYIRLRATTYVNKNSDDSNGILQLGSSNNQVNGIGWGSDLATWRSAAGTFVIDGVNGGTAATLRFAEDSTLTASIGTSSGAMSITGGAGNMVITSGTGNSRTLAFRTTTSGGIATTAWTLGADQSGTLVGALTTNLGLQTKGAADSGGAGYALVRVPN